jgi:hypothetical protein
MATTTTPTLDRDKATRISIGHAKPGQEIFRLDGRKLRYLGIITAIRSSHRGRGYGVVWQGTDQEQYAGASTMVYVAAEPEVGPIVVDGDQLEKVGKTEAATAKPAGAHGDAPKPRGRKKAAAKPAPAKGKGKLTGRQAVAKVLADGQPRKAGEITAAAVKLTAMAGKTPQATLGALLYTEAKKPDGLVTRTGTGRETTFALRATAGA